MMLALKLTDKTRLTPVRRLLYRVFTPAAYIEKGELCGRDCYYICAFTLDWTRIKQLCGKSASRLILPKGIVCPLDGVGYDRSAAMKEIFLLSALNVISSARPRRSVLFDRDARYSDVAKRLCESSASTVIITARIGAYRQYADKLLASIGTAPVVTDDAAQSEGCSVAIAPDGLTGFGAVPIPRVLFSQSDSLGFGIDGDSFKVQTASGYSAADVICSEAQSLGDYTSAARLVESFVCAGRRVGINELEHLTSQL